MNKRIRFTCAGYGSAPESFTAYRVIIDSSGRGNHSYQKIKLTQEQAREVGYCRITKGKEEAEKMIKRIVREYEKRQRVKQTYGFYANEYPSTYLYAPPEWCYLDVPIAARVALYRRLKEHFRTERHVVSRTATLDGNYRVETVEEEIYTADMSRPLIIRLKTYTDVYEK